MKCLLVLYMIINVSIRCDADKINDFIHGIEKAVLNVPLQLIQYGHHNPGYNHFNKYPNHHHHPDYYHNQGNYENCDHGPEYTDSYRPADNKHGNLYSERPHDYQQQGQWNFNTNHNTGVNPIGSVPYPSAPLSNVMFQGGNAYNHPSGLGSDYMTHFYNQGQVPLLNQRPGYYPANVNNYPYNIPHITAPFNPFCDDKSEKITPEISNIPNPNKPIPTANPGKPFLYTSGKEKPQGNELIAVPGSVESDGDINNPFTSSSRNGDPSTNISDSNNNNSPVLPAEGPNAPNTPNNPTSTTEDEFKIDIRFGQNATENTTNSDVDKPVETSEKKLTDETIESPAEPTSLDNRHVFDTEGCPEGKRLSNAGKCVNAF